jgi:hypothetical protein
VKIKLILTFLSISADFKNNGCGNIEMKTLERKRKLTLEMVKTDHP